MKRQYYIIMDEKQSLYRIWKDEYDKGLRPDGLYGKYVIAELWERDFENKRNERIEYYEDELRRILGISQPSN